MRVSREGNALERGQQLSLIVPKVQSAVRRRCVMAARGRVEDARRAHETARGDAFLLLLSCGDYSAVFVYETSVCWLGDHGYLSEFICIHTWHVLGIVSNGVME